MKPLLTLHDPATARAYYAAGLWREDTLYGLLARHAAARPADYALRDSTRRLTWAEVKDWTDGCAAALVAAGVDKGERVSLVLSNRVEAVVAFLACARQGYVCNPSLHRNYTVPLSHHIAWVGVAQCLAAGMEMVVNDPPWGMSPLDLKRELAAMVRDGRIQPQPCLWNA